MDLGIRGRTALVCGASKGLGRACAEALASEGAIVVLAARGKVPLEIAASEIAAATGASVSFVAADVTSEAGRAQIIAACPSPDILVTNAGGPPPGDFRDWSRDEWIAAIDANMLGPIDLIRLTLDGMIARRFGRIVNITSGAVKSPLPGLGLSNGSRAGLTGFVAGLSREAVRHNVTMNNLLPSAFATERLAVTAAAIARKKGVSEDEALGDRLKGIPAGRFGDPAEFGAACAFLCSDKAGFMTGQNLLLDGGAYPGVF